MSEWLSEDCQTSAVYIPEIDAVRVSQVGGYDEPEQSVYFDADDLDAIRALFPAQREPSPLPPPDPDIDLVIHEGSLGFPKSERRRL